MTMTGKEAMQALLDGKTLRKDGVVITPAEWGLLMKFDNGTCEQILLGGCEVVEEYPLTFEQALRAMLDGKVVMCEVFDDRKYFFSDGWFQFKYHDDDWLQDWFEERLRDAKWKVVE